MIFVNPLHLTARGCTLSAKRHPKTNKDTKPLAAPKACMRGDVVMVEQLLFFGISPDISCILDLGFMVGAGTWRIGPQDLDTWLITMVRLVSPLRIRVIPLPNGLNGL